MCPSPEEKKLYFYSRTKLLILLSRNLVGQVRPGLSKGIVFVLPLIFLMLTWFCLSDRSQIDCWQGNL